MKLDLRPDEITVINLMRKSAPYCKFTIEKRPTTNNVNGELVRIVEEKSTLLKDLIVIEAEIGSGL